MSLWILLSKNDCCTVLDGFGATFVEPLPVGLPAGAELSVGENPGVYVLSASVQLHGHSCEQGGTDHQGVTDHHYHQGPEWGVPG